jgi:hypothetical protein
MKQGKEIVDELKGIAPEMPVTATPYSVPEGYFDAFPAKLMQLLRQEEQAVSSVEEELESLSPFLAGLPRKTPFEAPAGYFNQLEINLEAITQAPETGKVVPMKAPGRVKTIRRILVAAGVAALLSVGGLYMLQNNGNTATKMDRQLAALSDQEIEDYLQTHTDDFDDDAIFAAVGNETVLPSELDDMPTDALEEYVDENLINEAN